MYFTFINTLSHSPSVSLSLSLSLSLSQSCVSAVSKQVLREYRSVLRGVDRGTGDEIFGARKRCLNFLSLQSARGRLYWRHPGDNGHTDPLVTLWN